MLKKQEVVRRKPNRLYSNLQAVPNVLRYVDIWCCNVQCLSSMDNVHYSITNYLTIEVSGRYNL